MGGASLSATCSNMKVFKTKLWSHQEGSDVGGGQRQHRDLGFSRYSASYMGKSLFGRSLLRESQRKEEEKKLSGMEGVYWNNNNLMNCGIRCAQPARPARGPAFTDHTL